jgi:exosortase E/protease (VPEID-CTERM system)
MVPATVWYSVLRRHRRLLGFAAGPALLVVMAIQASQALWHPAARVTFLLVESFLKLFYPIVYVDAATFTLGGRHFAIQVADQCSGLEGVGLMLIFCVSWLWYFRREYFMPRALLIIPGAVCLIFLLNSVRIALLLMIGDAGYPAVASFGFHSQAGWIAFNTAAFAVALVARGSTWLNRTAHARRAAGVDRFAKTENPTVPYLVPLLVLLAAGMLSHAMSAGFELLYPLRLVAAGIALWAYRRHYRGLGWGFSWRAVAAGAAISALWICVDHWMNPAQEMPGALAALTTPERNVWILCRSVAAIITVPLVEELAYRGFLMRRFAAAEFETLSFRAVRWPALVGASLVFGISHGAMWAPGVFAGLVFGYLAIRTGRIGEAVAAHATANAGLAAYVLLFDQWQLW